MSVAAVTVDAHAKAGDVYVFNRHVVYVVTPTESFDPGNSFMIRLGVSF